MWVVVRSDTRLTFKIVAACTFVLFLRQPFSDFYRFLHSKYDVGIYIHELENSEKRTSDYMNEIVFQSFATHKQNSVCYLNIAQLWQMIYNFVSFRSIY